MVTSDTTLALIIGFNSGQIFSQALWAGNWWSDGSLQP
ncbi:hypothetical protein SPLC1_S031900 [Arthrospira platensis C1]|nr:hypothetical protein SPLC1_S031900 [Arthrospira platensis C1]